MKANNLKAIADQLKGLEKSFKQITKLVDSSYLELSKEEQEKIDLFKKEGQKIANNKHLNFAEKMIKLKELKDKHGNSNDNK